MLINVAFGGSKLFEWEGDAEAVAKIDQEVHRIAKHVAIEPAVLAQSAVLHIGREGGFVTPNRESEMMLVIWMLISQPTGYSDRPGICRDYLEMWDFDFDVTVNAKAKTFTVMINGHPRAEGTA